MDRTQFVLMESGKKSAFSEVLSSLSGIVIRVGNGIDLSSLECHNTFEIFESLVKRNCASIPSSSFQVQKRGSRGFTPRAIR